MEVVRFKKTVDRNNSELDLHAQDRQPFQFRSGLTQNSFEKLLAWLSPSNEEAGEKYEEIRNTLIKIFSYRGCPIADELADETINRVAAKVDQIIGHYIGQPHRYFYGVANKVHLEYLNRPKIKEHPPIKTEKSEETFQCLDSCLQNLTPNNQQLALDYYSNENLGKIEKRKTLAESLGVTQNALRIRLYEIRVVLRRCVENCMDLEVKQ